jgi:Family of unknown function (DUF6090)
MQEEVIKHTNKIQEILKNSNHSLSEKLKEVFIEIFIIVFAVSLSIWLHSWSEHRHQQKEVKEFLMDLKEDLKSDIESVSHSKTEIIKNLKEYEFVQALTQNKIDSLSKVHLAIRFSSTLSTTKFNNGNYEGFKSSGKIGFIENKKLKKQILKYYQEQSLGILESEKYSASTFEKIMIFLGDHSDKGIDNVVLMAKFKQLLKFHTDQSSGLLEGYETSIKDATAIIEEIDKFE